MTDGAVLASVPSRAGALLGSTPVRRGPATAARLAAWRSVPVAVLMGLVVLAAGFPPPATASVPAGQLGYSAADDRNAAVAAFELDKGAAPGLSGAPFFELPCHLRGQVAPGVAPSRTPTATRDRSPPLL